VRVARENPRWGYPRIVGELAKLAIHVSPSSVRQVLLRAELKPVPRRDGPTWHSFLHAQAAEILACDFLCIDTILRRRIYVLPFIELETRREHLAGSTPDPTGVWVAQQARNLALEATLAPFRFLIRDRDSKFSLVVDTVFASEGIRIIQTPAHTPVANAYAERFVRTIRTECLDWLLIRNERHLRRVLHEHLKHDNHEQPHRGRSLQAPGPPPRRAAGPIERHDRLGGLIHDYQRATA
jgi:putative transposase